MENDILFKHTEFFRIRYSESDRMGYCYYGNYAQFMEVARVEALRSAGIVYRELEDQGVLLPVSRMDIKYIRPLRYDDQFSVEVALRKGAGLRLDFDYRFIGPEGEVVATAYTQLVFVNMEGRPSKPPESVIRKIESHA